ncbi:MAG: 50S ribosomal protein L17 [Bacteroidota bacterium]
MRHGKKFNLLGRNAAHRKALWANQAKSLILHKRIMTTVAKAKALRKFVEPLITKARRDTTHARRVVFSYLQDKEPVKVLFNDIAYKIGARPGGYTRIIKMGTRPGDNAAMCMIELVDYNTLYQRTKPRAARTSNDSDNETSQASRPVVLIDPEESR